VKTLWLQNFIAGRGVEQIHQVKEHTSQMCADLGTKKKTAEKIPVLRSLCGYREFKESLVKVKLKLMDTPMSRALGLTPIPSVGGIHKVPAKNLLLAGLLAMIQEGEAGDVVQFTQTCARPVEAASFSLAMWVGIACMIVLAVHGSMKLFGDAVEYLAEAAGKRAPRNVGVQSQCTYRRSVLSPKPVQQARFQVVEEFYQISDRAVG